MSQPLYAWRIWRLDPNPYGINWIPASEIKPALTSVVPHAFHKVWIGPDEDNYLRWQERRLKARCEHRDHPAPQRDCTCGIYGYPDLLDVLRLIPQYCATEMYAIGLIEGYGAKHNDGEIMMHDACMRFAVAEVKGFAQLGSGWRTGILQRAADDLGVAVKPLSELQAMAAKGDQAIRRHLVGRHSIFLDRLTSGSVTVAESALMVDRNARVFLRNDREGLRGKEKDSSRLTVSRAASGRFNVVEDYTPDGRLFLVLPFDGDLALAENQARLAGEVESLANRQGERLAIARDSGQVVVPPINRYHLIDTLEIGKRLPISNGVEFGLQGKPYLGRVVVEDDPARDISARAFVTRLDEQNFGLEFEGSGKVHFRRVIGDTGYRLPIRDMDTPVSRLAVNGVQIGDAELPWNSVEFGGTNYRVDLEKATGLGA